MRMTASLFLTRPMLLPFELVVVLVIVVVVFLNWRILSTSSVGELWWHNSWVDKQTTSFRDQIEIWPMFSILVVKVDQSWQKWQNWPKWFVFTKFKNICDSLFEFLSVLLAPTPWFKKLWLFWWFWHYDNGDAEEFFSRVNFYLHLTLVHLTFGRKNLAALLQLIENFGMRSIVLKVIYTKFSKFDIRKKWIGCEGCCAFDAAGAAGGVTKGFALRYVLLQLRENFGMSSIVLKVT